MSKLTSRGATGLRRPYVFELWIGLAGILLLIALQACQPATQAVNFPTLTVINPTTSPPTITVTTTVASKPSQTTTSEPSQTASPETTATTPPAVVFAAIGDFGSGNQDEADVANLILSWKPDFIITLGDNNYPSGTVNQMDKAVGQFFHSYIYPYMGSFGAGADVNRFFPSLGNHDLITDHGQPYYDYFTLPGNERYYDFTWGPVHLFALDDIESEPDGVGVTSIQAAWLKGGLAASDSPWNIVYLHYPPYSSGMHGSTDWARWPYVEWGADAVLAGHDHTYERLIENGLTYFVNGLGGNSIYNFGKPLNGSQVRYNGDYGAMRVEVTEHKIIFEFINRKNEVVDRYEMSK